jgi:hypothetical protein
VDRVKSVTASVFIMGGICSVCCAATEQRKDGAWEDAGADADGRSSNGGADAGKVPSSINVQKLIQAASTDVVGQYEDESECTDADDECYDGMNGSMADCSTTSGSCNDCSCSNPLRNIPMDLLLSDTDCDDENGDEDNDEGGDLEDDEDEQTNLFGESLFTPEADDSEAADEELLLDHCFKHQTLLVMNMLFLSQNSDHFLHQDARPKLPLVIPSLAEQHGCLPSSICDNHNNPRVLEAIL